MANTIQARVTKTAVERLEAGQSIRDLELKGFGARRQKDGVSYFLQKKINGRLRWITIGAHGSPWTPDMARKEAYRLLREFAAGEDPVVQRKIERAKPTLKEAAEWFMADHGARLKRRTREEYDRLLRLEIVPALGKRLVADITRGEISKFHSSSADRPTTANFALAVISTFMAWCEEQGYRAEGANPARGVKKFKLQPRERFLTGEEFARLGDVLAAFEQQNKESPYVIAAIRLLLLTGARLNEILTLEWRFVDFDRKLLLLPDSKTGAKSIPLNNAAITVLSGIKRVEGNPFVIIGRSEGAHLINLQKPWRRVREEAGLQDVRIHDLRHTYASMAAASGGSLPMIGKLLGHSQPQTTQRYAHLSQDPIQALNEDIGESISRALSGRTS